MAEEIKQVLGFDASQALETLNELDTNFTKFGQTLQATARSFEFFNQGAGKTVAALIQIKSNADAAADALNKLSNIKPPPTPDTGGGAGAGGTNLLSGQAAANAMAQLLGQVTTAANTTTPALNSAANAATATGTAAANAAGGTSGFAISLETLSRVIGTQVIVRALSALRTAIEGSFSGFIEFNRHIAEIQTIAEGEPIDSLAANVRKLSDEFNAPILDVAKAKYQILSNGFVTAADSTQVLTAALKFAKVGISDVASAADLISSALNAYGKSASEAEALSAKLFKTIELGRVIGQELANSFGRVAPVAKEIGASESEILAAFSSITIGGVKASEAATQIRAALTGLLKPSKDTQEALTKLGFETGEQLIRAKGLQGAFQALIGTTDGSTSSIAKLFPNVRALNGVLRETGTGASLFQEHLKQIEEASSELLNRKFELRIESNAEKVSADLNKLKNFFTADLGKEFVESFRGITEAVGGVDTIIGALKALTPIAAAVTTALVAYNVAVLAGAGFNQLFAATSLQAASATSVFGGALTVLVAAFAAAQVGTLIGESFNRQADEARKKFESDSEQLLKFQADQASARTQLFNKENDEKGRLVHEQLAEARKAVTEETEIAKEKNQQLIADDKATTDKIISARDKFANDLKRAQQQADNDIIDSQKRTNDLQGQLADTRFRFSLSNANELIKVNKDIERSNALAAQGASKLSTASTPQEKEAADNAFKRAQSFAEEAVQAAKTSGQLGAQLRAEQNLESLLQRRINAEKQFQDNRAKDAERLAAAAAEEEKRVTDLKSAAKEFLEKSSLFNKKGELLPKDQIEKNLADAKAALERFKETAFGKNAKFKLEDLFAFDKLEARLQQSVTPGEIKQLFASPTALDNLFKQVQGKFTDEKIIVDVTVDPSKLAGKSRPEQAAEAEAQFTAQEEKVRSLKTASDERAAAENRIREALAASTRSFNEQNTAAQNVAQAIKIAGAASVGLLKNENGQNALEKLRELRQEVQNLSNLSAGGANISPEQLNALADKFRALKNDTGGNNSFLGADLNRANQEFELLKRIFDEKQKTKELDKAGSTDAALEQATKTLQALQSAAATRAAIKAAAEGEKSASEATQRAADGAKTSFSGSVTTTSQIASNLERAAAAAERMAAAEAASSGSATAALGGFMQHFATGGFAQKGTDNIPAMLSNREFVTRAPMAERFHPQLVAMNAGVAPSFPSVSNRGGDVHIHGDINVNESSDAKSTAREVINLIRREQRRGTGSMFRN